MKPVQRKTVTELREEHGLTREELAAALHVPFSTLVNIEMGRNGPRVQLAERIYEFFKVPVGSIAWPEKPQKNAAA
jgi:DNA-binding XRE family transcriptional regulator